MASPATDTQSLASEPVGALSRPAAHHDLQAVDDGDDSPPAIEGVIDPVYLSGGGCATVWVGRSERLDRLVAVKVPRPRILSADLLGRFADEGRLLSRLRPHPNLVRVLGMTRAVLGSGQHVPAIVMELVPQAQSMLGYCDAQRLDERGRLRLFRAACAGVAHLHRAGVVHLDLKPSNILVDSHGVPKVADLGAARSLLDIDLHRSFFTPQYASPEQLNGNPEALEPAALEQTSDVYSLGKILAALLGGPGVVALPPGLRSIEDRSRHALAWSPAALMRTLGDPDEALCEVVLRATDPDPRRRYHDARELVAAVDELLRPWPLRVTRHATATVAAVPRAARRFGARCAGVALSTGLAVAASFAVVLVLHHVLRTASPTPGVAAVDDRVPPPAALHEACVVEIAPDTDLVALEERLGCGRLDEARPWTLRSVHALLVERLASMGARTVALDVVFPATPAAEEATTTLAGAIVAARSRHGCPVVVGTRRLEPDPGAEALEPALREVVAGWGSIEGFDIEGVGRTMPLLAEADDGTSAMGLAMAAVRASRRVEALTLEPDGVFMRGGGAEGRRVRPWAVRDLGAFKGALHPAPALVGARTAVHSSNLPPRTALESVTIDARDVLEPSKAVAAAVRGRIVVVSNNLGRRDEHPTRTIDGRPVLMPWWHATAIETMLRPTSEGSSDALVLVLMATFAGLGFAVATPVSIALRRWARHRALTARQRLGLAGAAGAFTIFALGLIGLLLIVTRPGLSIEAFSVTLSLILGIVIALTSVAVATRSWRLRPARGQVDSTHASALST